MYFLVSKRPGDSCGATGYQCKSDQCIPASFQCDGEFDCMDNSDEKGCGKPNFFFIISQYWELLYLYIVYEFKFL